MQDRRDANIGYLVRGTVVVARLDMRPGLLGCHVLAGAFHLDVHGLAVENVADEKPMLLAHWSVPPFQVGTDIAVSIQLQTCGSGMLVHCFFRPAAGRVVAAVYGLNFPRRRRVIRRQWPGARLWHGQSGKAQSVSVWYTFRYRWCPPPAPVGSISTGWTSGPWTRWATSG